MDGLGRILYVDAYDSFTNNVVGLLETQLNVEVTVVRIDNLYVAANLISVLASFDAVVVGPGPGHPAIADDIGFASQLWGLSDRDMIPIFGICLGFQSLALAFGANIRRMKRPRHGIVSKIIHARTDIFDGMGTFEATQYHSLCVDIGHSMQKQHEDTGHPWVSTATCPELRPLAWGICDKVNGPVLMSVKHNDKPLWGVQFHPESICTSPEGQQLIRKWWAVAQSWSTECRRTIVSPMHPLGLPPVQIIGGSKASGASGAFEHIQAAFQRHLPCSNGKLLWSSHPLGAATVTDICEAMCLTEDELVLLDSQGHKKGHHSIIGLVSQGKSLNMTYNVHTRRLVLTSCGQDVSGLQLESMDHIWPLLQSTLDRYAPQGDQVPYQSPFWGGWMGLISYEAGLETLRVTPPPPRDHDTPDFNFAFITRSIIIDHQEKTMYIQSLLPQDDMWLFEADQLIHNISIKSDYQAEVCRDDGFKRQYQMFNESNSDEALWRDTMQRSYIDRPNREAYCKAVVKCQESLSAGDSYELCLTDETQILIPRTNYASISPWKIYKRLRKNNPAPFGCYIRLPKTTVVGSSPERFLSWTRDGQCQFRPIKGTVKKAPGVDYAAASAILNTSKERAENLMIVDLIRHDLSGVVGAHSCTVSKLMQVEEYETVFQLVSVIEGEIPNNIPHTESLGPSVKASPRGIDVLKASLPPGSMTGAPKKRSCEILASLEQRTRGFYSGVLGYMDVGGGGDFSVIIRTAIKSDNDYSVRPAKQSVLQFTGEGANGLDCRNSVSDQSLGLMIAHDVWRVGAGGAITIQSTDIGEFNEMETKLDSVLSTFQLL